MASDPDSADEDFSFGAEPASGADPAENQPSSSLDEPIDYAAIDHSSRFVLALLAAWASPFLVDGIASAILKSLNGEPILFVLVGGVILGKFGLLSMWLGWGGSRFIWRMLVVMVSVLFTALAVAAGRDTPQMFVVVFLLTVLCGGAIAIPRLFGVHWVEEWTRRADVPVQARRSQFSILDILIFTTTMAIICGVISSIKVLSWMDVLGFAIFCLIAIPIATFFVLFAMWTELNKREQIGLFVALNYGWALLLSVFVGAFSRVPGEAFGFLFALLAVAISCILFALYLFRKAGDRLIVAKRAITTRSGTSASSDP